MTITKIAAIIDYLPAARDEALAKVQGNAKWIERIEDAYDWLLRQDSVEHYDGVVLMDSDSSDETYTVNGHCNCKAGQSGQMCKHRVRARLFKLALEKSETAAVVVPAPAPAQKKMTPVEIIDHKIAWAEQTMTPAYVIDELMWARKKAVAAEAEAARVALDELFV